MLVEQELCRKLVDIFRRELPLVEVEGNWLPTEDGGFKGEYVPAGSRLSVRVSPRAFTSYTDRIAEFKVTVDGEIRVEEDTDGSGTFVCCGKLLGILTGWQNDIAAVKRDLATNGFGPVGFTINSGGELDIERETLTRTYSHSFTIKGRIQTK